MPHQRFQRFDSVLLQRQLIHSFLSNVSPVLGCSSVTSCQWTLSNHLKSRHFVKETYLLITLHYTLIPILNPFPNKAWFLRVCSTSLLKTLWEKEKLLVTSNFSFSRSVFYLFGELSVIFIKFGIAVCKILQFGRV